MTAFMQGFGLMFSLILAIGAQNAFVLRTGLEGRHIFAVCSFCTISDMILVTLGINGMGILFAPLQDYIFWVYMVAAVWLAGYGGLRLRDAIMGQSALKAKANTAKGLMQTLVVVAGLTWLNPHVYLDTVVLLGSVSITVPQMSKLSFAIGVYTASGGFFFALGYGAKALGGALNSPKMWQRIDLGIAAVMFWISAGLVWAAITS